jgi:hypothetical protein
MLVIGVGRVTAQDEPVEAARPAQLPLPTTRNDFFLPGTQPGDLEPVLSNGENHPIVDPDSCATVATQTLFIKPGGAA